MGGCGVGDGVQDEAHGAHDVELHDGAPGEAFFAEGARRVHELEIYPITSNCDSVQLRAMTRKGRNALLRVVDLPAHYAECVPK